MRNELINIISIENLDLHKWHTAYVGTWNSPWHVEVLCEDTLLFPNIFAATGLGRNADSEKSTQSIPTRNTKNASQKPCQREGREGAGRIRLSEDHPGGTKRTSSGCKGSFELELKRLGPGRKRLCFLGDQET